MTIPLRCQCGSVQHVLEAYAVRFIANRPAGCVTARRNTCDVCKASAIEEIGWVKESAE